MSDWNPQRDLPDLPRHYSPVCSSQIDIICDSTTQSLAC